MGKPLPMKFRPGAVGFAVTRPQIAMAKLEAVSNAGRMGRLVGIDQHGAAVGLAS